MDKQFYYEIGLDLHKNHCQVAIVDRKGTTYKQVKIPNNPQILDIFFSSLDKPFRVTFESTRNYYWLADYLNEKKIPFVMANPYLNRMIATVHAKNDKYDAQALANLTRTNLVAKCYVPDKKIRYLRELVRHRASLIKMRTLVKNKIQTLLCKYNLKAPYHYVFGAKGRTWIENEALPPLVKLLLDENLSVIESIDTRVHFIYERIKVRVLKHPYYRILTSIPGIGLIHAATLIAEIADISRFRNPNSLVRYTGLSVNTFASADVIHSGHITKQSNKYIRTALVEAVPHVVVKDPGLRCFFGYLKAKRGYAIASVAVARKLCRSIYFMLKKKSVYKYRKIQEAWVIDYARITTRAIAPVGCNVYYSDPGSVA
jgi:transposase